MFLDPAQHIAGENMQYGFIEIFQLRDFTPIHQVTVAAPFPLWGAT